MGGLKRAGNVVACREVGVVASVVSKHVAGESSFSCSVPLCNLVEDEGYRRERGMDWECELFVPDYVPPGLGLNEDSVILPHTADEAVNFCFSEFSNDF